MPPNARANRYDHTPRKVFDKAIDRLELKRVRDREDHRADLQAIFSRMKNLETQLTLLSDHVESHCHVLTSDHETDADDNSRDTEELV